MVEADPGDVGSEPHLLDEGGTGRRHGLDRVGDRLVDAPEQQVVAQGGRRADPVGVVEVDAAEAGLVEGDAQLPPRLDQPLAERVVDEAEAVARLDIGERQGDEPGRVGRAVAAQPDPAPTEPLEGRGAVALGRRLGGGAAGEDRLVFRQLVGGEERELLEQRMPARQAAEDLQHGGGDPLAHGDEVVGEPGPVEDEADHRVLGQRPAGERRGGGDTEQQVLRHRRLPVVAGGIERLDEVGVPLRRQALAEGDPRLDQPGGEVGMALGIDLAEEAEAINLLAHADAGKPVEDQGVELARIGDAGLGVVDPVGRERCDRVSGAVRLGERLGVGHGGIRRAAVEAVHDVLAQGPREQDRVDAREGDAPGERGARPFGKVVALEGDPAGGRHRPARQHPREGRGGGTTVADDADDRRQRQGEGDVGEHRPVRFLHADALGGQPPAQGLVAARRIEPEQALGQELLQHLLVLHLHVEALLVPVDQLLEGRRQVAIGRDHRDELADAELALQGEVAADAVEQERRHLREQVVQELDHELAPVDAQAQVEQPAEAVADLGPLPGLGPVGMHRRDAVHHLADPAGEAARGELTLASEAQQLAPQARDDHELHPHHPGGEQPEPDVLEQDERHRGGGLGAEEGRQDVGVADEAADRLDLVADDGGDLGGLGVAQRVRREAHDQREQLEAQAPQHALAERPLGHVDPVLEGAVDQHQQQEHRREAEQELEPIDVEAVEQREIVAEPVRHLQAQHQELGGLVALLEGVALDRLVDDAARQVEGGEVERQRGEHDGADQDLVALRVPPDVAE